MRLRGLFVGKIASYSCGEISFKSAMKGQEVEFLEIDKKGIVGNEIADKMHHGGEDKAVFAYLAESYAQWESELGLKIPYGGMGENLLLEGVKENDLCVGDWLIFDSGVQLEISMPRVQCFKIPSLYPMAQDKNALAKFLFETGCVGFYLRVREGGKIARDSQVILKKAEQETMSLEELHRIYKQPTRENLQRILGIPLLAQTFKQNVKERFQSNAKGLLDWQLS